MSLPLSVCDAASSRRSTSSCTCVWLSTARTRIWSTANLHSAQPTGSCRALTRSASRWASAPAKSKPSSTALLPSAVASSLQARATDRKSRRSSRSSTNVCASLRATSLRLTTSMAASTACLGSPHPPGSSSPAMSAGAGDPSRSKSSIHAASSGSRLCRMRASGSGSLYLRSRSICRPSVASCMMRVTNATWGVSRGSLPSTAAVYTSCMTEEASRCRAEGSRSTTLASPSTRYGSTSEPATLPALSASSCTCPLPLPALPPAICLLACLSSAPITSVKYFSSFCRCLSVSRPLVMPASMVHASSWHLSLDATVLLSSCSAMSSCVRSVQ
mmetsp:Transcript_26245/g.66811  ORF Transcript_26245/g.66811 Transcript_26245/m.66811 type:complete len:331 (-) Transcript_26245:1345-2337(-)